MVFILVAGLSDQLLTNNSLPILNGFVFPSRPKIYLGRWGIRLSSEGSNYPSSFCFPYPSLFKRTIYNYFLVDFVVVVI